MRSETSSTATTGFFFRPTTNRLVTCSMSSAGSPPGRGRRGRGCDEVSGVAANGCRRRMRFALLACRCWLLARRLRSHHGGLGLVERRRSRIELDRHVRAPELAACWPGRESPRVFGRGIGSDAVGFRGIKKAGGLIGPPASCQAALPLLLRSRRAQISRVRGAERRAHPQLDGCGAEDADRCHLSETTPEMCSDAPGKDWRGHGAGGSIRLSVARCHAASACPARGCCSRRTAPTTTGWRAAVPGSPWWAASTTPPGSCRVPRSGPTRMPRATS